MSFSYQKYIRVWCADLVGNLHCQKHHPPTTCHLPSFFYCRFHHNNENNLCVADFFLFFLLLMFCLWHLLLLLVFVCCVDIRGISLILIKMVFDVDVGRPRSAKHAVFLKRQAAGGPTSCRANQKCMAADDKLPAWDGATLRHPLFDAFAMTAPAQKMNINAGYRYPPTGRNTRSAHMESRPHEYIVFSVHGGRMELEKNYTKHKANASQGKQKYIHEIIGVAFAYARLQCKWQRSPSCDE